MSSLDILEKTPLCITEMKQELAAIKKRDEELNFRAQRAEEYVNELASLKPKQSKELTEKLRALDLPRLKENHIKKIVDILPVNDKHLKMVLSGYTLTVNQENMKKIIGVVKEYQPKK